MDKTIQKVQEVPKKTWQDVYGEVAKINSISESDVEVMHKTVAKGTTPTEFKYFLNVAKASGLNPFLKEIWCYKDNRDNQIIFSGRDGFLKKAQENPKFNGIRSCEVCAKDEFIIDVANNKISHKVTSLNDRGEITGAYAIVFRKDGEPTIEIVSMKTYNKFSNAWKTHPAEMIKKVAEVHSLKKAFGISMIQAEEDFEIRGDKVLPLGTEASSKKITDGQIAGAIGEVYQSMLKNIDTATTVVKLDRIKKDIEKQIELGLLSQEAIEDLNIKVENKLNNLTNGK